MRHAPRSPRRASPAAWRWWSPSRSINASTLGAFTDAIDDLAGTAALQVRGPRAVPRGRSPTRVRELPGVAHAVPILTDTFFVVDGPAAGEALSVFAADVTDGHAIKTLRLVRSRRPRGRRSARPSWSIPASVILTDVFAHRIDAHVGTELRLRTPAGIQTFTVRGILPPGGVGRAFGGNLLLMDVRRRAGGARPRGTHRPGRRHARARASRVDARRAAPCAPSCRPGSRRCARRGAASRSSASCARTARCSPASRGWRCSPPSSSSTSAVATSVAARRQQIGLLRCIGAERRHVLRLVLGEARAAGRGRHRGRHPARPRCWRACCSTPSTESTELVFSLRALHVARSRSRRLALALGAAAGLGATLVAALAAGTRGDRASRRSPPSARPRPPPVARRWPAPGVVLGGARAWSIAGLAAQVRLDSGWARQRRRARRRRRAGLRRSCAVAGRAQRRACSRPLRARLGFAGRLAVDRLGAHAGPARARRRRARARARPDAHGRHARAQLRGIGARLHPPPGARRPGGRVDRDHGLDRVAAARSRSATGSPPCPASRASSACGSPSTTSAAQRISIDSLDASAFAPERRDDFVFSAGDPAAALAAVRGGDARAGVAQLRAPASRSASATGSRSTRRAAASRRPWPASSSTTCRRAAASS